MAFGLTEERLNQEKYQASSQLPIALVFSIPLPFLLPPLPPPACLFLLPLFLPPCFSFFSLLFLPPLLHIRFLYDLHSKLSWDALTTPDCALGMKCILEGPGFTFPQMPHLVTRMCICICQLYLHTAHTSGLWKGRWSAHTQEPQHMVQEWSQGDSAGLHCLTREGSLGDKECKTRIHRTLCSISLGCWRFLGGSGRWVGAWKIVQINLRARLNIPGSL